jgi:ADP-heptose:LPS heptosyltransferase
MSGTPVRGATSVRGAVLAIRPRTLGDVVLVTPALRALARGYPGAALEVVTEPAYRRLLEAQPGVARVWPMARTARGTLALIAGLRRRGVAVAVDFFGNPRTALLTRSCGAPATAGFDLPRRRNAYRVRVPRELRPGPDAREYAAATHVRLAVAAGGIDDGVETRITLPAEALARADELLRAAGIGAPARTIGLVAAGTWATKTWPLSHAAGLARGLLAAGHEVLLLAGPGEARVSHTLADLAPGVRILPPCDICEMAAVIRRLRALAGTDSGPRHLAAAFGVPTFSWFGPTHPDTWTAPGPHAWWRTALPCRACDRTVCPHWNCLPGLAPEEALARLLAHLETHGTPAALGSAARS